MSSLSLAQYKQIPSEHSVTKRRREKGPRVGKTRGTSVHFLIHLHFCMEANTTFDTIRLDYKIFRAPVSLFSSINFNLTYHCLDTQYKTLKALPPQQLVFYHARRRGNDLIAPREF